MTKEWRAELYATQQGLCAICGRVLPDPAIKPDPCDKWRLSFDHIIPRAEGGRDHLTNYQLTHQRCNERKGALTDWSMYPCRAA